MKISNRNYPILEKLNNCSLGVLPMYECDLQFWNTAGDKIVELWKYAQPEFIKQINIISEPFYKSSKKAMPKLLDLYQDIIQNDLADFSINGTYIYGNKTYMIHYETKKGTQDNELFFFVFDKRGVPKYFFIDSWKKEIWQNGWISKFEGLPEKHNSDEAKKFIYSKLIIIILLDMFKKYAEIETKYLPPNKITKDINCKYVNDTKLGINILDSKWFTTLVKSDAFTVHGHFRLQPCGKDMKDKKLIWINDFMKTGYTARARKLAES